MKLRQILALVLGFVMVATMCVACANTDDPNPDQSGDKIIISNPEPHAKDDPIYYVSTRGDDSYPGTEEAPFATIEAARDAIRAIKAEGLAMPFTVKIMEGTYKVEETIVFDPQDSGTAEFPITYEAVGEVVFTGGLSLKGTDFVHLNDEEKARLTADAAENVMKIDLTSYGLTKDDWGELSAIGTYNSEGRYDDAPAYSMWSEVFINDERMTLARYPNVDYIYTTVPISEGDALLPLQSERKYTDAEWWALRNPKGDVIGIDADTAARAAAWETLDGVWIFSYPRFDWADMSSPVTAIDATNNTMSTKYVSMYGLKENAPYYFYNVFEEMDIPGEWYLDRNTGMLYVYPKTDISTSEIEFSLLNSNILRTNGTDYITFKGLTFTAVRNSALEMRGSYVSVIECNIKNVTGNAMALYGNHNYIAGCEMSHLGAGGIVLDGGDRPTLTHSETVVENNHIHHFGEITRTYSPAISVPGCGHIIRYNTIHHAPHMAIGFGGNENVIEYNEIYSVCLEADDSGAIYGGKDYTAQGNIIRYNYFHDIYSIAETAAGVFGVYCDDCMGGSIVEHNVFRNVHTAQMYHGGHNMIFRENLIIDAPEKSEYSLRFGTYSDENDLRPGGQHEAGLAAVPYTNELWTERYPQIQEYLTWSVPAQTYPHYCDISNNIIINHKPFYVGFKWDTTARANRMDNNLFLDASPEADLAKLCGEVLPSMYDTFTAIPLDQIGCSID